MKIGCAWCVSTAHVAHQRFLNGSWRACRVVRGGEAARWEAYMDASDAVLGNQSQSQSQRIATVCRLCLFRLLGRGCDRRRGGQGEDKPEGGIESGKNVDNKGAGEGGERYSTGGKWSAAGQHKVGGGEEEGQGSWDGRRLPVGDQEDAHAYKDGRQDDRAQEGVRDLAGGFIDDLGDHLDLVHLGNGLDDRPDEGSLGDELRRDVVRE
mmetsp:Transcript_10488/g.18374  ORF Transcript_10488/g.18374 Transcript_10488/m.18374 type:complete len:209 (-) Transcript_10488:387-1013(-)